MTDTRSPEQRSRIMASVKGSNTGPELEVRRLLHRMGYRYRLHRKDLPGKPDIVLPGRSKIIFVHGCFWHGHRCKYGRPPKSNKEYWLPKLKKNRERDKRNIAQLKNNGWSVLVVWQCETKNEVVLKRKLKKFLDN